jgi:hypothetical protein
MSHDHWHGGQQAALHLLSWETASELFVFARFHALEDQKAALAQVRRADHDPPYELGKMSEAYPCCSVQSGRQPTEKAAPET